MESFANDYSEKYRAIGSNIHMVSGRYFVDRIGQPYWKQQIRNLPLQEWIAEAIADKQFLIDHGISLLNIGRLLDTIRPIKQTLKTTNPFTD